MGKLARAALRIAVPVATLMLTFSSALAVPYVPSMRDDLRHKPALDHLKKKEFSKAAELENKALEADPGDINSYVILAIAYIGMDNEKKAIETAAKAREIRPEYAADVYLGIGNYFRSRKRLHKALFYFRESLKLRDAPEANRNIASIYLSQGLYDAAKAHYEKTLEARPDYIGLSRTYLAKADYDHAISYAQKAVKNDVKDSGGYLILGTGYLLTDRLELAKACFMALKELSPEFHMTSYFMGLIRLAQQDFAEALSEFNVLKDLSPKLKEPHLNSAVIWHIKGNIEKAREEALKAIEADPLDPGGHFILGNIYLSTRDFDKADKELMKAEEIFPDFGLPGFRSDSLFSKDGPAIPALLSLSMVFSRAGLYNQAVKVLDSEKVLKNPVAALSRIKAETKRGNSAAAEVMLASVSGSHPGLVSTFSELGEMYESVRDYNNAAEAYGKAAAMAPRNTAIGLRLAGIYELAGKYEAAANEYKRVISISPETVTSYSRLAYILSEKAGKPEEALKYGLKGASINPEDAEAKDALGWTYYRLGRFKDSINAYNGIEKAAITNPVIYFHIALINQKLDNSKAAAEALEKALNLKEEFEFSKEARELLKSLTGIG